MCYYIGNFVRYVKGGDGLIRTDKLRGIMAEKGYSQKDMAAFIGVTPKTFYRKMKNGVFDSDEIQVMMEKLKMENPMEIFFAKE